MSGQSSLSRSESAKVKKSSRKSKLVKNAVVGADYAEMASQLINEGKLEKALSSEKVALKRDRKVLSASPSKEVKSSAKKAVKAEKSAIKKLKRSIEGGESEILEGGSELLLPSPELVGGDVGEDLVQTDLQGGDDDAQTIVLDGGELDVKFDGVLEGGDALEGGKKPTKRSIKKSVVKAKKLAKEVEYDAIHHVSGVVVGHTKKQRAKKSKSSKSPRKPHAYNVFVKDFAKNWTGERKSMMKEAGIEWQKKKMNL